MKLTKHIGIAIATAFLCVIPIFYATDAADQNQVYEINIDDGEIPDLGLSIDKDRSFKITEVKPPQVTIIYGSLEPLDGAEISLYFYDYDLTTYMEEHILMYESNVVKSYSYRVISWENNTQRYALLYEHLTGDYNYGLVEFTHGTTLASVNIRLRKNMYSDAQLIEMIDKLEAKAQELLSIQALSEIEGQVTGFTIPMKHIKVSLSDGEITNETTTDAEGNYNFSRPISKGKEYNLTVTFSYVINSTTLFSLHYQENNQTVISFSRPFTVDSASDLRQDIALDQELQQYYGGEWAKTFASMYVHFTEALEFYKIGLDVDVNFQLPLDIYTFCSDQTGTRYWYNTPGKSYITISADKSIHESVYRPRNREYHEFSHYMMHTIYQKWPAPADDLPVTIQERNHDGFLNPSTSDSYVEGFAEFMAAVMLQTYQEDVGTIPMIPPDTTTMTDLGAADYLYNTQWYGLELNAVTFGDSGRAEENAIAGILWDLYDEKNDYCDKTPEQMLAEYQQRLPEITKEYEKIKESFEEDAREYGENDTYPLMKIFTLDDFKNAKFDDDNATLGFKAVWDIIKDFHNHFASIYNELIAKHSGQKKAIDEVFIAHAFFIETETGDGVYTPHDIYRDENRNGKYDLGEYFVDYPTNDFNYNTGEVVGQSANYERLWRQSVQEKPGYFIKTDNKVPFYLIKISFPNQFYLDYVVRVWNDDGMINIPVPPEGYQALITVLPEGAKSNEPLKISSEVFQTHYDDSLAQGYYVEHDFEISGSIPSLPSMPRDSPTNGGSSNDKTQTPGFELILFLVAFLFVAILLRKRKLKI
ncbi:MAG TPA: carboxypeptidase regulatory-like domain-containing protein [Thermoplasmata archaeon]|nr:carboxypeptidase regulatory-like domain-containing protein [Thermoplasmata archaeon]